MQKVHGSASRAGKIYMHVSAQKLRQGCTFLLRGALPVVSLASQFGGWAGRHSKVVDEMAKKQSKQNAAVEAVMEAAEITESSVAQHVDPQAPEAPEALGREMVTIDKMRSDRAAEGKGKRMALVTGSMPERFITVDQKTGAVKVPQPVIDGILNKHIAHAIEEVVIKAKTSPTKKDEARQFDAFYALDAEGMMILCNGKIEPATPAPAEGKDERTDEEKAYGACDHFNYGRLLNVRQVERGRLEASIEGPEKQIAKLVKAMIDGNLADNEQEARDEVITRLKKKGQLAPDYVWSGAQASAAA